MLQAFTSVEADRFHVTFTNLREEETGFFKNRTVPLMRYNLPAWVKTGSDAPAHYTSSNREGTRADHSCR